MDTTSNFSIKFSSRAFIVYILLCIYFFQERCTYADSAMYLFQILNKDWFNTPHQRFGAMLPQLPVVIADWIQLPKMGIYIIYSVAYPLFYYLVFLICVKHLKNFVAGLSILLFLLMGVQESYFNHIYEFQLAVVYTCLFYAFIASKYFENTKVYIGGIIILAALIAFTHIQILPLLLFVCVFHFLDQEKLSLSLKSIAPLAISLAVFAGRLYMIKNSSYQSDQISSLDDILHQLFNLDNNYTFNFVLNKTQFGFGHFLMIVSFFSTLFMGKWKTATFTLISYIGYFVLISCMIPGESQVVLEKNFMPLVVIAAFPFINNVADSDTIQNYLNSALVIIGCLLFTHFPLKHQSPLHAGRLFYQRALINQIPDGYDKGYIYGNNVDSKKLFYTWANATETLLLSYLDNKTAKTIYIEKEELNENQKKGENIMLFTFFWKVKHLKEINPKFGLKPGKYIELAPPLIPNDKD